MKLPITVALIFVVAAFTSGCLGGSSAVSTTTGGVSSNGMVSGSVVIEGGPTVVDGSGGSDIRPVKSAPLLVTGTTATGSKVVRHLATDAGGRFRVVLPPGDYTIAALIFSGLPTQPQRHVVVKHGQSVTIQIKGNVV